MLARELGTTKTELGNTLPVGEQDAWAERLSKEPASYYLLYNLASNMAHITAMLANIGKGKHETPLTVFDFFPFIERPKPTVAQLQAGFASIARRK